MRSTKLTTSSLLIRGGGSVLELEARRQQCSCCVGALDPESSPVDAPGVRSS